MLQNEIHDRLISGCNFTFPLFLSWNQIQAFHKLCVPSRMFRHYWVQIRTQTCCLLSFCKVNFRRGFRIVFNSFWSYIKSKQRIDDSGNLNRFQKLICIKNEFQMKLYLNLICHYDFMPFFYKAHIYPIFYMVFYIEKNISYV